MESKIEQVMEMFENRFKFTKKYLLNNFLNEKTDSSKGRDLVLRLESIEDEIYELRKFLKGE